MKKTGKATARVTLMMNMKAHVSREVVRGVARYVAQHARWDCNLTAIEGANVNTSRRAGSADGIIIQIENQRTARAVKRSGTPAVNVGSLITPGICTVSGNSRMIGRAAAEYLHDRGFRRFGYFANYGTDISKLRGQAFKAAVESMGCSCDWFQLKQAMHRSWRRERAQLSAWLKKIAKPVAILTVGDPTARMVAMACEVAGFSVPEEVAILGMGNDDLLCDMCSPEISSIETNVSQVGFEAARLLHRRMEGESLPEHHAVPTRLRVVTRASTDIISVADPRVSKAARWIAEKLAEGASIKRLVTEMDISRRTLERAFREHLGRTIHDEIVRAQLQRVVQLLEEGAMPLSEVAARSGMRGTCRLSHFVKKHTGMTPWTYRRAHARRGG